MNIFEGIGWHMVGAGSGASFYAPITKVKKWTWESTWVVMGSFSWFLLPIGVSFFLLPHFTDFYKSLDHGVVLRTFLFGAMWGIGNVNYGLTMRYLGMALGIGVAIGVTLIVGTLIPPIAHGHFHELVSTRGGLTTMLGIAVALGGVCVVSYAGHQKEIVLGTETREFDLKKGLFLALMCGIFSSGMSFGIDAGKPIQDAAQLVGVKPLYSALPAYMIIMAGGGLINFAYCFFRLFTNKDLSVKADLALPASDLLKNGAMAAVAGILWYFQFFFYAWGAANIPVNYSYVNWMLHMSGYVLFGAIVGLALGEWVGVGSRPIRILWAGMVVIIIAANIVGLGIAS